jgi:DNA-binding LytR/AlgR family response regulator
VGFLILTVWNGLSFIALYFIMGSEYLPKILNVLPTKIILGSLIYSLIVMFFNILLENLKTTETINEEPDETEEISDKTEPEEIEKLERIVVKTGQKLNVITIPEIVYFQAEGDYVRIVADTGRFLKEDTIKFFQARLPETEFVRVHRSYLVNISKILRIELYGKQNHQLTLNNGDKLKISASGYKRLREVLGL